MSSGTKLRINFTDRMRIERSRVHLALLPGEHLPELTATVDLEGLELDPSARVIVEAYRQTTIERLEMGSVGHLNPLVARPLAQFRDPEGILCRIKVIASDPADPGRLLAVADKLRPEGTESKKSGGKPLLSFRSDPSLGQRVWALDVSEDAPFVRMNPRIGPWNDYARSPEFATLVLPELLAQVVLWVISNRIGDEVDGPIADWFEFINKLGTDLSDADHDAEAETIARIVEDAVSRFSARHNFADLLGERLEVRTE